MPQPEPCPRCNAARLSVVYFDSDGKHLGGHLHCPDCGPRHNQQITAEAETDSVRQDLLKRKAS
jgi:transcription elongation factor Elf1